MAVPVLGLASPAGASANAVPFKASVAGTFTSNFPILTYAGTGNASHLGKIRSSSIGVLVQTETLTAANGDTLTLLDIQTVISTNEALGQWTVTGGTGRFSNANGSGTSDLIHTGGSAFTQTWTGTIAY
jgi:hypothetical protein